MLEKLLTTSKNYPFKILYAISRLGRRSMKLLDEYLYSTKVFTYRKEENKYLYKTIVKRYILLCTQSLK